MKSRILTELRERWTDRTIRIDAARDISIGKYFDFPSGFIATNPSLAMFGGGFVVCARAVNYLIDQIGRTHYLTGSSVQSKTSIAHFSYSIDRVEGKTKSIPDLDGIEDIRLFVVEGTLYGIGSEYFTESGIYRNEMRRIRFNSDFSVQNISKLKSPFGRAREKNWMPLAEGGVIRFVYSINPLIVLEYRSGGIIVVKSESRRRYSGLDGVFLSGSSAFQRIEPIYIGIVHCRLKDSRRSISYYVNRVVCLSQDLSHVDIGCSFSMGRKSIQFVNGFSSDASRTYISYGLSDASAHIAVLSHDELKSRANLIPKSWESIN